MSRKYEFPNTWRFTLQPDKVISLMLVLNENSFDVKESKFISDTIASFFGRFVKTLLKVTEYGIHPSDFLVKLAII
jgi:hypothetical protein